MVKTIYLFSLCNNKFTWCFLKLNNSFLFMVFFRSSENITTSDVILHNDSSKCFINLKSTQNIRHKQPGLDMNHIIHRCKCSLSYFKSIIIQYDVGGWVICISNKVEYVDKEGSYKNSTKEVVLSP